MKSQVLPTVWCNISGEAAGEIWNWSLLEVKGFNSFYMAKMLVVLLVWVLEWEMKDFVIQFCFLFFWNCPSPSCFVFHSACEQWRRRRAPGFCRSSSPTTRPLAAKERWRSLKGLKWKKWTASVRKLGATNLGKPLARKRCLRCFSTFLCGTMKQAMVVWVAFWCACVCTWNHVKFFSTFQFSLGTFVSRHTY